MCYISDWPKRFLKTILHQLSRHQVCMKHAHTHADTSAGGSLPCDTDRGDGVSVVWCFQWSAVRRRLAPAVCPFLQVESLIENEAEKDYLYDVLRMYHQWVPSVTAWGGCSVYVCEYMNTMFHNFSRLCDCRYRNSDFQLVLTNVLCKLHLF